MQDTATEIVATHRERDFWANFGGFLHNVLASINKVCQQQHHLQFCSTAIYYFSKQASSLKQRRYQKPNIFFLSEVMDTQLGHILPDSTHKLWDRLSYFFLPYLVLSVSSQLSSMYFHLSQFRKLVKTWQIQAVLISILYGTYNQTLVYPHQTLVVYLQTLVQLHQPLVLYLQTLVVLI